MLHWYRYCIKDRMVRSVYPDDLFVPMISKITDYDAKYPLPVGSSAYAYIKSD